MYEKKLRRFKQRHTNIVTKKLFHVHKIFLQTKRNIQWSQKGFCILQKLITITYGGNCSIKNVLRVLDSI